MSSPDDSVFSPPLYDTPRSVLQGRPETLESSGHDVSPEASLGQANSGQGVSGQEESERWEECPEMTYDVPKALLEPPSPLVEFDQVGGACC